MIEVKRCLKLFALAIACIPALPLILIARVGSSCGSDDFFAAFGCLLSLIPGKIGSCMRLAFYKGTLESISSDVVIGFGSFFSRRGAVVGRNVCIGGYCILGKVLLGDRVLIASRVSIPSGKRQHGDAHGREVPTAGEIIFDRVAIGNDCWVGEGAIVMADVGERSIVSAGAVVTRAMPPFRLIGGNPARVISSLGEDPGQSAGKEGAGVTDSDRQQG